MIPKSEGKVIEGVTFLSHVMLLWLWRQDNKNFRKQQRSWNKNATSVLILAWYRVSLRFQWTQQFWKMLIQADGSLELIFY